MPGKAQKTEEFLSNEELESLFNEDPVAKLNEEGTEDATQNTDEAKPEEPKPQQEPQPQQPTQREPAQQQQEPAQVFDISQPAQQQQPQPAQPQPTTPLPSQQQDPEMLVLKQTIQQQSQQIQQLMQQLSQMQQQPQQQPTQQQPQQPEIPQGNYAFNIPLEYAHGIQSDDPNVVLRTLQSLLQAAGQAFHQQIYSGLGEYVERSVTPKFNEAIQQQVGSLSEQQRIREDFYGAFPQLNQAQYRPMVLAVAQQVMRELGTDRWSEPVRNMVGARVIQQLQAMSQGVQGASSVQQAQQPQSYPAPVATPAPQMPAGVRPGTIQGDSQQDRQHRQVVELLSNL